MKEKIFIGKWLFSIFIGLVAIIIGMVGFVISYMEMGIFFLLFGVAILFWFFALVPHSFIFDNEKILMVCFFTSKTVKYVHIKSCDKEESGKRLGEGLAIIIDALTPETNSYRKRLCKKP